MPLEIHCPRCGEEYPLDTHEWVCVRCRGHLEIRGTAAFDPALVDRAQASIWRYRALLPLPEGAEPVSLGEGWTPLVPVRLGTRAVHAKLDFLMPSGSFKDRGSSVLASALRAFGVQRVVEDSSGNAAASLAAYAARAGLEAQIFVPAHTVSAKVRQTEAYGARLEATEGPRENAADAAQQAVVQGGAYYASHYYNPFALAGMETTAWELWEQLDRRAPDQIVLPVGNGTNFVGLYRGWCRLRAAGLIDRLPRLCAAQAAAVAPLALAFANGASEPAPVEPKRTAAEGIAVSRPVRGAEILAAIRETRGTAVAVDEDEIRVAQHNLARQGLLVEPTSATAVAALDNIGELPGLTVVSLTGSGLKTIYSAYQE
ncbi:MAG: pyridoxal-phosphate dependent enzyme [Rudaea sp.]